MIRLWLWIPAVQKRFECTFPLAASFKECIPYLNRLLDAEFEGWYMIPEDAWFIEPHSGIRISSTVTISNQNLEDGMCLFVC